MEPAALARRLAREVVVLDGGLATQLEAAGADLSDALWSARLLLEDPASPRRRVCAGAGGLPAGQRADP